MFIVLGMLKFTQPYNYIFKSYDKFHRFSTVKFR